jgi:two-component system, NarL family, sensor kinase
MQRFILIILTLLGISYQGLTQDEEMNELLQKLKFSKEDTGRINILHEIQGRYLDADNDSALYYNIQAEALIDKLGAESMQHRCYHAFVKIYHAKFDNEKALEYCLKGVGVAKKTNDLFQQASSYRALFSLYYNLRKNDSAIKYSAYAVDITERIKDTVNIATMYGNLSRIYNGMELYDKSVEFGKKGVDMGGRYNDQKGLLISMNNLGNTYISLDKNKEAIDIFEKQFVLGQKVNRIRSVSYALINLGVIYYNMYDKINLQRIVQKMKSIEDQFDEADRSGTSYRHLVYGYDLVLQNDYTAAEGELLKGMLIAEKDSITDPLLSHYTILSSVKFLQQDIKAGESYLKKWDKLKASTQKQEMIEYSMDLEKKYETEAKISKIKLQESQLKQKTTVNYLLIASAMALLIISLLLFRNYRHKQKLQQQRIIELETEKKLTATEAVLKGEEQERTRLAKDLHDGLGGMLSGIKYSFQTMKGNLIMTPDNHQAFERSMDMLDSSIKEMRRVAHNMMPEALVKFGLDTALKDFCNDINQSGALRVTYQSIGLENAVIDQTTAITIYRIVQELINNTMKHAAAKSAIVQVTKTNGSISITVEDDGKGFDPAILKVEKGIGWSNIHSRVEYLKGKLDVQSEAGKGTSVLIELKA